jgi:hypothetical protein
MEAAVEELTPLGVLKQPKVLGAWSEVWTCSRAGIVHSNLAGARDIERRAIPKGAMPAVPPPAWKLGFDKPCRSVNRARHIRRGRTKCTLELAVEFRRATGSGLDLVQKFPQVHFSHPPWADGSELYSKLLSVVLMKEMAMNGKKRAMIYGPKTDRILAGVLTVASGGWIILILLGYLESQGWAQVPGLFVLFGIGVASLLTGKRRT